MIIAPYSNESLAIISTGKFKAFYAARLDFKDGVTRIHTDTGDIVINGETYNGIGNFGSVADTSESVDSKSALSVELTLSGLNADIINEANVKGCRGREGKLFLVVVDENGNYAADIIMSGRMDAAQTKLGKDDSENSIVIPLVDRMAEWENAGTKRVTDESQQARNNGDRIFYAVGQMASWPIYWGQKKDAQSFTYE
ncbi:MAG: hypothetical protein AB7F25_07090 [Deferribacterales bacterium]